MANTSTPSNKDFEIELNSFRTVNTKDSPVTMKDDEMPILINFMPIGTSLNVVPGYSAVLATIGNTETVWTAAAGVTINVTVRRPAVPNGFIYVCSQTGTTGGTEPTWTTDGSEVTDNTAKWQGYSCTIKRFADVNIGGTIYKLVATEGGALYKLDPAWVQTRLNVPSVVAFTDPQFEQWKYTRALIIDPTAGYYDYDGTTLTHNTAMSAPTIGTCIAIWKASVFIGNGRTIYFTAPDDGSGTATEFADFRLASGGGFQVDTYSSLRNQINALVAAQDYLYVVGDHATHIITSIQTISGTAQSLTILDAVPGIGSPYPDTVRVLGSEIVQMGNSGVNAVSGANYNLLSSMLDGMLPGVDTTFKPVAWFGKIFNKQVFCLLVRAKHPIDGTLQKFILTYYEDRWFYILYGQDFTFAAQSATALDTESFASYGNNIIQIFTSTSLLTKKMRMKAMNLGSPIIDKQVLWLGATLVNTTGISSELKVTMKAIGSGLKEASATASCDVAFYPDTITWLNESGNIVPWFTSPINLTSVGWNVQYSDMIGMKECDGRGKRIQVDFEETSENSYSLTGIMIGGQYVAHR